MCLAMIFCPLAQAGSEPFSAPPLAVHAPNVGPRGDWGMLEYESIPLENYDAIEPEGVEHLRPPHWVFENFTTAQLNDLINSCNLNDWQKTALLDTNNWEKLTNGYAISPDNEFVLGLGKSAKQTLYPILARSRANYVQSHAAHFPITGFDQQLADSGLSPKKIELVRQQTYTNAGLLYLCIDGPLQSLLGTNDFNNLARTLYTAQTWSVQLRVSPDADVNQLVKYWGRGGREGAVRPMIESLARMPGGGTVNISFFLPPFARLRLYNYPDPVSDPVAAQEDCFYTALNFTTEQGDPRLADGEAAKRALLANYNVTTNKLQMGDIITLVDTNNVAIHACAYVADDIVFTKEGSGLNSPWVLMKIHDMLSDYPNTPVQPWRMVHFTPKSTNWNSAGAGKMPAGAVAP
jgi:hypothetical protein